MSSSERRERVKNGKACFYCLMRGHSCKICRVRVQCGFCTGRHMTLMCTRENQDSKDKTSDDKKKGDSAKENKPKSECSLASLCSDPEVFMQTLCIKLRNGDKELIARAIIDTGSQKSYITQEAANCLGYDPIAEQLMSHSLFGGEKTEIVSHKKYRILLEIYNL